MDAIPFNMNFHIDRNLREQPEDLEDMKRGIRFWRDQLETTEPISLKALLNGRIGVFSRIVKDLDESERRLRSAIDQHDILQDHKQIFVNQLRLAHTYQWKKEFTKANQMFNELMMKLHKNPLYQDYKDFLYQHYAKCKFDEGKYDAAYSLFQVALRVRIDKGNYHLIRSTEACIKRCRELRQVPG